MFPPDLFLSPDKERSTRSHNAVPCLRRRLVLTVPLVFVAALLLMEPARSDQEAGTAIPAESMYHTTCTAVLMLQGTTLLTILEVSCLYCLKTAI